MESTVYSERAPAVTVPQITTVMRLLLLLVFQDSGHLLGFTRACGVLLAMHVAVGPRPNVAEASILSTNKKSVPNVQQAPTVLISTRDLCYVDQTNFQMQERRLVRNVPMDSTHFKDGVLVKLFLLVSM